MICPCGQGQARGNNVMSGRDALGAVVGMKNAAAGGTLWNSVTHAARGLESTVCPHAGNRCIFAPSLEEEGVAGWVVGSLKPVLTESRDVITARRTRDLGVLRGR